LTISIKNQTLEREKKHPLIRVYIRIIERILDNLSPQVFFHLKSRHFEKKTDKKGEKKLVEIGGEVVNKLKD